jgi:hypothetical protein
MFSTVPGFDSPRAALRSEKDVYVSANAAATELLNRNPKGESFSSSSDDIFMAEVCAAVKNWRNGIV